MYNQPLLANASEKFCWKFLKITPNIFWNFCPKNVTFFWGFWVGVILATRKKKIFKKKKKKWTDQPYLEGPSAHKIVLFFVFVFWYFFLMVVWSVCTSIALWRVSLPIEPLFPNSVQAIVFPFYSYLDKCTTTSDVVVVQQCNSPKCRRVLTDLIGPSHYSVQS